ncbi:helix-turn-helix domain-containing protein [Aquitalea sp. LB_tupeE]|uniref:helix-turn-helix domain-containing protein n=1 Tax=Aquitalea sp. LB_tupeE TaxID=2748078 RepID=UPI0015B7D60E|nr:helix-turn-helix domain-containing protein [Aquitalea sp. LB_tupeE]NWK80151.1 helix-turn-helix domain-containing protein [Aquitalea sp. LB_tupeE]
MQQPSATDRALLQQHSYSVSYTPEEQVGQFTGWTLQYRQLSGGRFCARSSITRWPGFSIHAEELNKRILQRGRVPQGQIAVGIPLVLQGHSSMCGSASSQDTLHVFSCYPEFEFASPENHLLMNLEFNPSTLSRTGQDLAKKLLALLDRPSISLQPDTANALRNMIAAARLLISPAPDQVQGLHEIWRQQLEQQLLYGLIETLSVPSHPTHFRLHRAKSWKIVQHVEALLADPASCALSVSELCVQLNMSRRTLQYAFEYAAGMSPVSFLRAIRLNHARQTLLDGRSVTYAATQWGFLHLGAFAHDYQQLFGELPSVTQKRLRQRPHTQARKR